MTEAIVQRSKKTQERKLDYLPTPAQIRQECLLIQESWDDSTRRSRSCRDWSSETAKPFILTDFDQHNS